MKNINRTISIILVCCLSISMIWCPDDDCMKAANADLTVLSIGGSSDHNQNSSAHSKDNHTANCTCLCHIASVEYKTLLLNLAPPIEIIAAFLSSDIASLPGDEIFRPPLAA